MEKDLAGLKITSLSAIANQDSSLSMVNVWTLMNALCKALATHLPFAGILLGPSLALAQREV